MTMEKMCEIDFDQCFPWFSSDSLFNNQEITSSIVSTSSLNLNFLSFSYVSCQARTSRPLVQTLLRN